MKQPVLSSAMFVYYKLYSRRQFFTHRHVTCPFSLSSENVLMRHYTYDATWITKTCEFRKAKVQLMQIETWNLLLWHGYFCVIVVVVDVNLLNWVGKMSLGRVFKFEFQHKLFKKGDCKQLYILLTRKKLTLSLRWINYLLTITTKITPFWVVTDGLMSQPQVPNLGAICSASTNNNSNWIIFYYSVSCWSRVDCPDRHSQTNAWGNPVSLAFQQLMRVQYYPSFARMMTSPRWWRRRPGKPP